MAKKGKVLSCAVVLALAGIGGAGAADVYELSPIVVTAERMDTKELETPAAVEVMCRKR